MTQNTTFTTIDADTRRTMENLEKDTAKMESQGCVFCHSCKENSNVYICGNCTQKLLMTSNDKLVEARDLALAKGYSEKVEAIERFAGLEEQNGRQTRKFKRSLVRKRPGREARLVHNSIRTQ